MSRPRVKTVGQKSGNLRESVYLKEIAKKNDKKIVVTVHSKWK